MRHILALAAAFGLAAGATHAQFQPIQPIEPPKNPYAMPKAPSIPQPRLIEAPQARPPELFKPYKPYTGVNPDEGSSGLYPELHKKKKKSSPADPF